MDNQQGTPTEAEIAWLGGIIDGEGSLAMSLWQRSEREKAKIGLQVKVYNTDGGIIRKAAEILELLAVGYHLREREMPPVAKPGGDGHYRSNGPMLTLTIARLDSVHAVLTAIRPWLFGEKGARADLMLMFLDRRFAKFRDETLGKRAPYDSGDVRLVLQFYEKGTRPGSNIKLVERLLNELEQCAA